MKQKHDKHLLTEEYSTEYSAQEQRLIFEENPKKYFCNILYVKPGPEGQLQWRNHYVHAGHELL